MLSKEEKIEMLKDAKSKDRRKAFRFGHRLRDKISLDEYISFLDSIQKMFSPFKISRHRTITKLNKL